MSAFDCLATSTLAKVGILSDNYMITMKYSESYPSEYFLPIESISDLMALNLKLD